MVELADHPNRLLVTVTPDGGETYAEVAHEAIFRRWKKLRDWIDLEREFLSWKTVLDEDRRRWEGVPEPSKHDALLMGLALAQAQGWLVQRGEDLSKDDREFINLSQKAEAERREATRRLELERVKAAEEVARLRAEREAQRVRKRYYWMSAAAGGLLFIFLSYFAYSKYEDQKEAALAARTAEFASLNFELVVNSAQKLLEQLENGLNHGDIGVKGAKEMIGIASEIVEQVHVIEITPETKERFAKLFWTTSDIYGVLGDLKQAYDSAKSAKELAEPLYRAQPNNPKTLDLMYNAVWRMGDAVADQDSLRATQERALSDYFEAERLARRLVEIEPAQGRWQRDVVFALQKIGDVRQVLEEWPTAITVYKTALEMMEKVAATAPQNRLWQRDLANTVSRLGQALAGNREFDAALTQFRTALKIRTELASRDVKDDVLRSNLATSHREIARLYAELDQFEASLAEYRAALGILEPLTIKDPANVTWQISLAPLYTEVGQVLKRQKNLSAALQEFRNAYRVRRDLAFRDPTNPVRQSKFASAGMAVAEVLVMQNQDADEAIRLCREAIDSLDDWRPRYDRDIFRSYMSIGNILASQTTRKELCASTRSRWQLRESPLAKTRRAAPGEKI